MAGGCAATRLKAMCWAGRVGETWEVAVPVTISEQARNPIDVACKYADWSGRPEGETS